MKRQNLINARKDQDLTQVETADLIGITERQYQSLEAGTSKGSVGVWKKLKQLFGKTIDYLLHQEES